MLEEIHDNDWNVSDLEYTDSVYSFFIIIYFQNIIFIYYSYLAEGLKHNYI